MPDLIIRQAALDDLPALTRLAAQLGYPTDEAHIAQRLRLILPRDDHVIFAAERDGAVVGWIHGFVRPLLVAEPHAAIGGLVVDEAHRGLQIGARLMAALEAWARDQGCAAVMFTSNIIRERAHRFYERLGYEIVKTSYTLKRRLDDPNPPG